MKPLVIYHANCTDGFGAAFAAWKKFGNGADYLPLSYGDTPPDVTGRDVVLLDLSFPFEEMQKLAHRSTHFTWLDHHKTAFEMWCGRDGSYFCQGQDHESEVVIELDNDRSGALIAWEHFCGKSWTPLLIKHISDRDLWRFELPGSREIHAALQIHKPWTFEQWSWLDVDELIYVGTLLLRAHDQQVTETAAHATPVVLHGMQEVRGLMVNAPPGLASDLGNQLAQKCGTFGMTWFLAGNGQVNCSLRSIGELDVSALAQRYGGGGHRNAAGFRMAAQDFSVAFLP